MKNSGLAKHQQKEKLYALFAEVANGLANPHRLELLDLLVQSPRTVEELARETFMSIANTSQHLQRLKRARLVEDERDGLYVRYRLASPEMAHLWLNLRAVGEQHLADVERALSTYRNHKDDFEKVTPDELLSYQAQGKVTLVDVRPAREYQAGHLPAAISIPLDELAEHLHELPKDRKVIGYCRGPYCGYADQALQVLSSHGWEVARLEEGIAEWRQMGYALEEPTPSL